MEKGAIKERGLLNLEKFASVYIENAFKIAEESLSRECFDEQLMDAVSKETGLSEKQVLYLHHAFYWEFFCNNNSVFEYVQTREKVYVRLKGPYTFKDIENMKKSVLEKHRGYLQERINSQSIF